MGKLILIIGLVILVTGCQRGKLNELSVDFNKSLIIPPIYDLPAPGSDNLEDENALNTLVLGSNNQTSSNEDLVSGILSKTTTSDTNINIRDQIDYDMGYKSEEGFFSWLLKGKSMREKNKKSSDTVDAFKEKSDQNTD
ncbi:MAG: hypothetical protein ACKVGX_02515 [Alphaproteobacteria bacterium]|jgi:hypothetical protein|tara:strand:+ start:3619 stop:4035 length:417 start_codon:yes stop_codon:yes gene_type:complete